MEEYKGKDGRHYKVGYSYALEMYKTKWNKRGSEDWYFTPRTRSLPWRDTEEEAEADLKAYAERNHLKKI